MNNIKQLIDELKNRRKSHAKKHQESEDSYQEQYCHGRIDELDFVIRRLTMLNTEPTVQVSDTTEAGQGTKS